MRGLGALSLAEIRERFRTAHDAAEQGRLAIALRRDPRSGARLLGRRWERRLEAAKRERRRIAALFARRRRLRRNGARFVAGVDEAGMGPLAGPIVAAAVVLPDAVDLLGLNDSKRVDPANRERLATAIRAQAVSFGLGWVEPAEIDRLNVYHAGLEAMRRAVAALEVEADHLLVDARRVPGVSMDQTSLVGGDARDGSIAAASILAKVHRDGLMEQADAVYPGYGFRQHKGYPTPQHLAALRRLGPCPIHRRSYAPVAQLELRSGDRVATVGVCSPSEGGLHEDRQ